jgi:hypothetical protein
MPLPDLNSASEESRQGWRSCTVTQPDTKTTKPGSGTDHKPWQHSVISQRGNLAAGLFRLNGLHTIKEATEVICRDRALPLLAT